MKEFVLRCLLLLALAPALLSAGTGRSSVLVVYDEDDSYALPCFEQIIVTLEYNHIPYTTYNLSASTSLPPLGTFLSVVTATEMLWKLDPAACSDLKDFVGTGGGLAVLYRGWNQNLRPLLGIENVTAPLVSERKGKGLKFTNDFIPGINGTVINTKILADISAFDLRIAKSASVLATTAVDDLPAAWVNTYGKGRIIYWNCTVLSEKIYRGLIIPSLSAVQPMTFSLILNLGVVCLDDFPNATPNVKVEPIKSELNLTVSEFNTLRWFPDMVQLAEQFGLHYTAGLTFGYSELTQPPYTFTEWARSSITRGGKQINSSIWLTREAQKTMDVGFHGQNHQPLTLAIWKTGENMKLSLAASQRRWQNDNLGPAPVSYIPPMNIIDSTGLNVLTEVFPSIRVFGSQYMGKFELGQNREFGTDPWNPRIVSIPRITSGFIYDDYNRFLTLSELQTVGAWTHFVHPDDIIPTSGRYAENTREDLPSENISWLGGARKNGLYYQFEEWLSFVKRFYPWLRYNDYAHSYNIVKTYEASTIAVAADRRHVSIRFNRVPNYCVIHVTNENAVVACSGGTILHADKLAYSTSYVIQAQKNDVVLSLRDSIPTILYRSGKAANIYLAGNSRYSSVTRNKQQYPNGLASIPPVHAAKQRAPIIPALEDKNTAPDEIAVLQLQVDKDPRDLYAWERLSMMYTRQGRTEDAIRCNERIVKLLPNDTSWTKTLAREYVAMDKKEKAIPLYESIVQRYDNDALTWYALYELLMWSERPRDAQDALAGYVRSRPGDDAALQKLAESYVANERQKEAIPLYEKLVQKFPDRRPLTDLLAQLYTWNNLHAKAAQLYELLYDRNTADSTAAHAAIREYQAAQEPQEAVRMLEQLLLLKPEDIGLRRELIAIYRGSGDIPNAIHQTEMLLQYDPENVSALTQLGEMLLWQDRQTEAIGVYERIVRAEPDSLAPRITLAHLYSWNKRPADALAESKRILRRDWMNTEALRLVAQSDRANGNWFDARAWYSQILARQPADKEARDYLVSVRREHGLQFTSAYEWIDDSNDLTREELPVSVELLQTHTADYFLKLRREHVQDNRAGLSAIGYGAGLGSRFSLGRKTALTLEALATRYDSNWVPITARAGIEHSFGERVSMAVKLERSETVEGIQSIRSKIYTTTARGEMYWQTTNRWSISGLAEFESYSDDNLRSTGELLTTYKIVMRQPQLTLQASSIYQDTRRLYPSSQPYWTPSELFTSSAGLTIAYTFFGWFTPEVSEGGTVQGKVFSNTFAAKITIQFGNYMQLIAEYGKIGSTVYNQNVARASLSYRY
jgi:tetratricopeptide (TPR) repeat protein